MNIKISEFNLKKLVNDAGSTLSRVVQVSRFALSYVVHVVCLCCIMLYYNEPIQNIRSKL